jgi:rSAM/selenodomain-associated transferase 2/rSAM/selenodomain-associated transferase 1
MSTRRFKLRIVMPVLNEGAALGEHLKALQSLRKAGAELVVVDGGSTDDSWALALPWVDRLVCSPQGRAAQMNAGAADTGNAQADALLFLHADTKMPSHAFETILQALNQRAWGRFDVRLDSSDTGLRLVETMMNLRSRLTGIATGDQAIFVRADVFRSIGGFADQPLMEDIELSRRLLKLSRPACLDQRVQTSARKWERGGVWRTVWLMWRLRWAYFFGTSPEQLALQYGYRPRPPAELSAIAILAKAPVPGMAKTRLIPLLGASGAARAQRQFIGQMLHTAQQSHVGAITLWCTPNAQHRRFRTLQKHFGLTCLNQPEGDLGDRMHRCAEYHFAQSPETPLLIIGTDCPVLSPGRMQEAARSLLDHDACLISAEDGGYVLLGLKKMIPEVFTRIEWSTPRVLQQTQQRLSEAGASVALLPMLWDVDEPADWQRWQAMKGNV